MIGSCLLVKLYGRLFEILVVRARSGMVLLSAGLPCGRSIRLGGGLARPAQGRATAPGTASLTYGIRPGLDFPNTDDNPETWRNRRQATDAVGPSATSQFPPPRIGERAAVPNIDQGVAAFSWVRYTPKCLGGRERVSRTDFARNRAQGT